MATIDRRGFLERGAASAGLLLAAGRLSASPASDFHRFWPQWRGPLATGEAPHAQPPLEWDERRNVRWKAALPGEGKSTPIVWDDLVVVTAAVASGRGATGTQDFVVLGVGRSDGSLRWRRTVRTEAPHEGTHADGSYAAGSAITDGRRVYAFFGSRGLFALDMAGGVLWEARLGRMQTRNAFGEGASPALHRDTLIVNWDHEGGDFIAGFDAASGRERWRRRRDEPTTWTTPLVVDDAGGAQAVVGGTNAVCGYDVASGTLLWEAPGLTANAIPSPVHADGIVYAMSGFRGHALRAIRIGAARGAVSGPPGLAWSYDRDTPYVPSPLLHGGLLYFLKSNSGILTCLDAKTGALRFTERLEGVPNVYASPVAAAGRIYVVGREGATVVLEAGPRFARLATNPLADGFDASPALVDGELFLRGRQHLYCISSG